MQWLIISDVHFLDVKIFNFRGSAVIAWPLAKVWADIAIISINVTIDDQHLQVGVILSLISNVGEGMSCMFSEISAA